MKFAVVIVTYNRKELLKECIHSVLTQLVPIQQVIIVDNASTDGTETILAEYKEDSRFVIEREKENRGGAYGFYKGLKVAQQYDWDWVTIIDDDAILDINFIKNIEEAIYIYPCNKAFSGTVFTQGIISQEHRARNKFKHFYKPFPVELAEYEKHSFEYDFASFCGLVVSRDVIEKIGLPLKELFIRNDDYEYSMRIRQVTRIRNLNRAVIDHKTTIIALEKDFSWKLFYNMRNAIYIANKYFGSIAKMEICFRYSMGMVLNIIKYGFFKGKPIKKIWNIYRDAIISGMKNEVGINKKYQVGVREI